MLNPCRLARVPLVIQFLWDDDCGHAVGSGGRYRELFDYAHALVVLSGQMREQVLRVGAPPEKVHVIPYGVDTRLFMPAHPGAAPARFLAVGRFAEKQAPHLLVAAMSHVVRVCPDVRLTMVGAGPLLEPCRQLARALHVDHAIEFTGARGHDVVAQHMREARAFVQHAITTAEGECWVTPVSLLEAMVSGLPVIAARQASIAECVTDGATGLLVDEEDVDSMAERMIELARDPHKAAELGGAARIVALERFSLGRSLGQLAAILRAATPAADTTRHT
jgi:glycosyltransferase involved in cell wall biosynthesis